MRVLIISADDFEDTELLVPLYRLREAGVETDIASLKRGSIKGKHGYEIEATLAIDETSVDDYDALILPGGKAPAALRENHDVLELAREFCDDDKLVAAICHGPQILASAGALKGRSATCYQGVAQELRDAGAHYLDQEVVVDRNLITSRHPGDLPAFNRELMRRITA